MGFLATSVFSWPLASQLFLLVVLLTITNAEFPAFAPASAKDYDAGLFGFMPTQNLSSTNRFNTTHFLRRTWNASRCERPGHYYFIDPQGYGVYHNGPEIIDDDGRTVWFGEGFNNSYNFRPQMYKGEWHLTLWSGKEVPGHGEGRFYILNHNYQIIKNFTAVNGEPGDGHDFEITPEDTAVVTAYKSIEYNLTSEGLKEGEGEIWEGSVQEIDLETGELLFSWRPSDHVSLSELTHIRWFTDGFKSKPWDCFHLNSVQKDKFGNYLISLRHASTIYYVSGATGEILWRLGGRHSDFKDLSSGRASNFFGQHHVRWYNDMTTMTIFDNRKSWDIGGSRAMKLAVDLANMTVTLAGEAIHPQGHYSATRGSAQLLDDGVILVGYGSAPAFAEFSTDGKEILCDWQFGALHMGKNGAVTDLGVASYRAFRMPWKGYPLQNPDVAFDAENNTMYVSWNGATEVRQWMLEGYRPAGGWKNIAASWKTGFETNMSVTVNKYSNFRLFALDATGASLGQWTYNSQGEGQIYSSGSSIQEKAASNWKSATVLLVAVAVIYIFGTRFLKFSPVRAAMLKRSDIPRWARISAFQGQPHAHGVFDGESQAMPLMNEHDAVYLDRLHGKQSA